LRTLRERFLLRWINAEAEISVQFATMERLVKFATRPGQESDTAVMTAVIGQLELATVPATVPAAWPSGISQLAQAIDACQRYDAGEVRTEWLARRG
jgi:hypothetical protein